MVFTDRMCKFFFSTNCTSSFIPFRFVRTSFFLGISSTALYLLRKLVPRTMSAAVEFIIHAFNPHVGPFFLNFRGKFLTSPLGFSKCPVTPCILYVAARRIGLTFIFSEILSKNLTEIIVTEDPVSTKILLPCSSTKAEQYVGPETSVSPYCRAPCEGLINLPPPVPSTDGVVLFPVLPFGFFRESSKSTFFLLGCVVP